MKFKKTLLGIIACCTLLFQMTTVNADTYKYTSLIISNENINQELTDKAHMEIINKFTDKAKEKINLFNILIVNKPLSKIPELPQKYSLNNAYAGNIDYKNKQIIIDQQFYKYNYSGAFYHELGHCLDANLLINKPGLYSDTDQYKQVIKSEPEILKYADEVRNNYDIHEQFANLISFYLIAPDSFNKIAPKTFNYFESLGIRKQ